MTVFVVPCGDSILRNLADDRGDPGNADTSCLDDLQRWADLSSGFPVNDIGRRWGEVWTQRRAYRVHLENWEPRVGAELSTLAKRTQADRPRIDPDDTVVLLASDTAPGLLSALLTGTYLSGGDPSLVRCSRTDPTGRTSDYRLDRGLPCVVTISRLRPGQGDRFRAAAGGIGDVLRRVSDHGPQELIEIHLTGGYKPVLLHTLVLAEVLRSVRRRDGREEVSAWHLADDLAPGAWPALTADEIGLRCFNADSLGVMETELRRVDRQEQTLGTRDYEGVAWDCTGLRGTPTLNAFGEGYLAVLGAAAITDVVG